jgi:hypothetical protein
MSKSKFGVGNVYFGKRLYHSTLLVTQKVRGKLMFILKKIKH